MGWENDESSGVRARPRIDERARHGIALRVFSFLPFLAQRGIELEELLAGTGVTRSQIRAGRGFVPWDTYCTIAQRLRARIPDDQDWIDLGGAALDMPALRVFGLVASMFTDEIDAFRWWQRGFGPASSFVPFLDFRLVQRGDRALSIEIAAPGGALIPDPFRLAMRGAIVRLPTLLGRPPATVSVQFERSRVTYQVVLAKRASVGGRLKGVLRATMGRFATEEMRSAHEALHQQNRVLIERMEALARADEERAALERRLEEGQRMEAIGRLAGGIAHDFNNILTVLTGRAELLAEHADADVAEHGSELLGEAERASRLVRQLLSFSRQHPVEREVVEMSAVIADLRRMLATSVGERFRMSFDLSPADTRVLFNRSNLEQIVVNLVVNARDAMTRSGTVTVSTGLYDLDDDEALRHPDAKAGRYVELLVRDDGEGMDEETRSRAFEPFFTTKSGGRGTGLGLATVYGLVRQADGIAEIRSHPLQGTSVRILIPHCEASSVAAGIPPPSPSRASRRKACVLVVEDQPAVRSLARRVLQHDGHAVYEAASANEALDAWDAHPEIDLVITDVVMPGLTGPELVDRLRTMRPSLPVLFVSGFTEREALDVEALPPRTTFMRKPYRIDELFDAVQTLLAEPA